MTLLINLATTGTRKNLMNRDRSRRVTREQKSLLGQARKALRKAHRDLYFPLIVKWTAEVTRLERLMKHDTDGE